MTVLSYLKAKASAAVLSTDETLSIQRSISTLTSRLDSYFDNDLKERFKFGSSMRGTILPRSMDANSDIDFMVVFKDGGYQPQTYLDRLRRFVDARYSRSEVYQSQPTIVLELNHIKFELVPALSATVGYYIPANGSWQVTYPFGFAKTLEDKNKVELYMLKPAIRLLKFWNALNGYPFASFEFEQRAVSGSYTLCYNLQLYFFTMIDNLSEYAMAQWRVDKIQRAKRMVAEIRRLEGIDCPYLAEQEIRKLLP